MNEELKPRKELIELTQSKGAELKAQHEQDAQTIKVLQAMVRHLKAQPTKWQRGWLCQYSC